MLLALLPAAAALDLAGGADFGVSQTLKNMAGFKPSPPSGARPGAPRLAGGGSPLEDDSLRATFGDLIGHGQGQPKQVAESLSELRFGGGKRAQRGGGGEGNGAD